ncbi:MAG: hypothetical protein IIC27_04960, partial [Chloroflexi bacterium]|nr:hypothetical protein [Chloroflexota bacterium]
MKRSTDRILTTHAGRLPNPTNMAEVQKAKASGDQTKIDEVVTAGILEAFARQRELKNDIHSDGEFWKGRDENYFAGRTTGVEAKPVTPDNPASMLANMQERHSGQFDDFYAAFDRVGNTPQPGQDNPAPTQRWVITGAMENKDEASSKHEVAVVKAALEKAGVDKEDFFYPVLSPGWLGHSLWNKYYKTEEEYVYAMAEFYRQDYEAVA